MSSGAGYVFSAASPAFVNTAASEALSLIIEKPQLRTQLRDNAKAIYAGISKIKGLVVDSDPLSPVCHVRIANEWSDRSESGDNAILDQVL